MRKHFDSCSFSNRSISWRTLFCRGAIFLCAILRWFVYFGYGFVLEFGFNVCFFLTIQFNNDCVIFLIISNFLVKE